MEAALRAVNSSSVIQQYVGIKMLNKVKDLQMSQSATMLADFAAAQPKARPTPSAVGMNLDVRV